MDITQCSDCSIRVIVVLLIVSPNSLKIYLINILNLLGVPNLHNEINIDAISMGFAYKNEYFLKQQNNCNHMHLIVWNVVNSIIATGHVYNS